MEYLDHSVSVDVVKVVDDTGQVAGRHYLVPVSAAWSGSPSPLTLARARNSAHITAARQPVELK